MDSRRLKNTIILGFLCSVSIQSLSHATPAKPNEQEAIFKAAGFKPANGAWRGKCSFGHIVEVKDFNGDGRPDAIIRDGGTSCYGTTGVGFHLITKQKTDKWTRILNSPGDPVFLKTIGRHGWPDLLISTPSKCHQVYSWDGSRFAKSRTEYKGQLCTP